MLKQRGQVVFMLLFHLIGIVFTFLSSDIQVLNL